MPMIRDPFASFFIVQYFTSCYSSNYYCSLDCRNTSAWIFNRHRTFTMWI